MTHARLLAQELVGDNGELQRKNLNHPQGQEFLRRWNGDDTFFKSFRRFSKPLCHRGAEKLIRESLLLKPNAPIEDRDIRRAVVSACLTPLRQNVGSCFATAPAILIQSEQIDRFVQDLYDLLSTGKLKRTFGGTEYSVPLNLSWGVGDLRKSILQSRNLWMSPGLMEALTVAGVLPAGLPVDKKIEEMFKLFAPYLERGKEMTLEELLAVLVSSAKLEEAKAVFRGMVDHALLKAWEFTLASLSEVKMEFSRWNLYQSLGLHHEEKGGIGQLLYKMIDDKLQASHQKAQQFQLEYEQAFDQLRLAETLLKRASTESEARRLQAEVQARYHHFISCQEIRDQSDAEAKKYSLFFSFLLHAYDEKFRDYFQETYDPEMVEHAKGVYEDSPAGFRLYYKHGRADASLWTAIHTESEFIHSLTDFFSITEASIAQSCKTTEEQKLLSESTSAVIQYVRSSDFLEFAKKRMAKMGRAPWSYVSGGTMETLVRTYYRREGNISQEERKVENPLDLLNFLLETMKNLPPRVANLFIKDRERRLLMQSPTHAFTLLPGHDLFFQGWQDEGFTYTWIRDRFIDPGKEFYSSLRLSPTLPKTSEAAALLYQRLPPAKPHLIFADTNWANYYFAFVINPLTLELELWRVDRTGSHGFPMTSWESQLYGKEKRPWVVYTNPEEYV